MAYLDKEENLSPRNIGLTAAILFFAVLTAIACLWNSKSTDAEARAQPSHSSVTADFGNPPVPGKTLTNAAKTPIETALLMTPWPRIDATKYMRIHDRESAEKIRADIVKFVWPSGRALNDLLTKQPDNAFPSAELWTLTMKHGIVSRMLFVKARTAGADCLFIFHTGHEHPTKSIKTVRVLATRVTEHGCDVIIISLPLYGLNKDSRFQSRTPHDDLRAFETADFSPLSYFIEPVLRAVDEATKRRSYARIGMSGFSGGGWATTFAGAVEPRLQAIYPIAGSMPLALDIPPQLVGKRNVSSARGDYEQNHPIYRTVTDYFDFYLLDVFGSDRRALHYYIQRDDCCFPAAASHSFSAQMTEIALKITGNSLTFIVDTAATKHELSLSTIEAILEDFTQQSSARAKSMTGG